MICLPMATLCNSKNIRVPTPLPFTVINISSFNAAFFNLVVHFFKSFLLLVKSVGPVKYGIPVFIELYSSAFKCCPEISSMTFSSFLNPHSPPNPGNLNLGTLYFLMFSIFSKIKKGACFWFGSGLLNVKSLVNLAVVFILIIKRTCRPLYDGASMPSSLQNSAMSKSVFRISPSSLASSSDTAAMSTGSSSSKVSTYRGMFKL